MSQATHLAAGGLALALLAAGWSGPVRAAECGDLAGSGGTRVACSCGDDVVTDTRLAPDDGVVSERCADVGLVIARDGITLDCDGLRLWGSERAVNGAGVVISTNDAVVQRCEVVGFENGIRTSPEVSGSRILRNTVFDNFFAGIHLFSRTHDNQVLDNVAKHNGEVGIQINSSAHDNHVAGNRSIGHLIAGIRFNSEASGNRVVLNQVSRARGLGIQFGSEADHNHIASNTVDGGSIGINFNSRSLGNIVTSNTISDTSLAGIRIGAEGQRNRIGHNLVSDNGGEGVRIEEEATRNLVARNLVFDNEDDGIEVCGMRNVVARNQARFNEDWDICAVAGNVGFRNDAGAVTFECQVPPDCEFLPFEVEE